jgi:hypothetical protein
MDVQLDFSKTPAVRFVSSNEGSDADDLEVVHWPLCLGPHHR